MWEYDLCVIGGAGHVGLPLALAFAHAGKKVIICDNNLVALEVIGAGRMPFREEGAEEILKGVIGKTLYLTDRADCVGQSKFVVIVIGTPVDEHLNPKFALIKTLVESLIPRLCDDQIIILCSTVYPGTSEKMRNLLRENGKKVEVTFCPERIAEGQAIRELMELPQIVSGFDEEATRQVADLFRVINQDVVFLAPLEAELAKLFTNVYRYVEFSIANQFFMIANDYNIDYSRIHQAITYKYPRASGFPRAGFAAGPCLFKDCMQLGSFNNNNFFLGHAAMLINEGMPNYVVQRLKLRYPLRGMKVGILGMAYKGDSDDPRESLSFKLKKILEVEARKVYCSDVYIKRDDFLPAQELVGLSDIIILAAPHKEYKGLDLEGKIVVDIWNFFGKGALV